jgi:DNA phosphorothioation-dependent restriction protein DptH
VAEPSARQLLSPAPATAVEDAWVQVILDVARAAVEVASAGQCLRLGGLPRSILERVATALAGTVPKDGELYLIDECAGPEPWRVGVHKVVERRNESRTVVVALVPPDIQLAAEDSVDVSTFREIPLRGVDRIVTTTLLGALPPGQRELANLVLADLDGRRWPITVTARHAYLCQILNQQVEDGWPVGAALFELGLIPDFSLGAAREALPHRIGLLNVASVVCLSERARTSVERVLRLSIRRTTQDGQDRGDTVERLISLFANYDSANVRGWGREVATTPIWRDLALETWPLENVDPPGFVRIDLHPLKLARREDGRLLAETSAGLPVAWETTPKPIDMPELAAFRIELVGPEGIVAWESALIKPSKAKGQRRQIKNLPVETGVYFVRVSAQNVAGDVLPQPPTADTTLRATNESEDIVLVGQGVTEGPDTPDSPSATSARSYADAEVMARWAALRTDRTGVKAEIEWTIFLDSPSEIAHAAIRFDLQRQYSVRISQTLRRIELGLFASPEVTRWRVDLEERQPEAIAAGSVLPSAVAQARREVMEAIAATPSVNGAPVTALANLRPISKRIDAYATAYLDWLREAPEEAVLLDTVSTTVRRGTKVMLVAPTHPLRLLWSVQEHELGVTWAAEAARRSATDTGPLRSWQDALALQDVPSIQVLDAEHGYVDVGPLPGGWGLYLPTGEKDSRSLASHVRRRLGGGSGHDSEADVGSDRVASILKAFLRQHPYASTLVINVINPGDAALAVDALRVLERDLGAIAPRYELRLFTAEEPGPDVGRALRDLLDPESRLSEEAARLASPSHSFLFPKLLWSLHSVRELVDQPEAFGAHVTLMLDAFPVALRIVQPRPGLRSSFVHGLVQDPVQEATGRDDAFSWSRVPAPRACLELPGAPGRSALIAEVLSAFSQAVAEILAPGETSGGYATTTLDLSVQGRSLLYAAHISSAWVVTVDAHLGLDYFDSGIGSDRQAYLLDFSPEFLASGGRRLLLTTRELPEVARLMTPVLDGLDFSRGDPLAAQALIEALRSLSGRLALRLQSSPAQVQGVLGIALSRLFLEAYGLLGDALVIPLDAHPELAMDREDPAAPRLRSDLLVVRADPKARLIDFLIVETKCIGGDRLGGDLRERIEAQVNASEESLRRLFAPKAGGDRIDRAVMSWRLTRLLDFYLDRAARYGLVGPEVHSALQDFYVDLEAGYELQTRRTGLVFALGSSATRLDTDDPDLPIWVVGQDVIQICAKAARERLGAALRGEDQVPAEIESITTDALKSTDTWDGVRKTLAGKARSARDHQSGPKAARPAKPERAPESKDPGPEPEQSPRAPERVKQPPSVAQSVKTTMPGSPLDGGSAIDDRFVDVLVRDEPGAPVPSVPPSPDVAEAPRGPDVDVFLGDVKQTRQYGLLGSVVGDGRSIGLDLNGCNTISIFGVQGGGKSYTLGSIIEMAVAKLPGLNLLPRPLAAVVFHYHQTQDYPPEFVSMGEPNKDPEELAELDRVGGSPAGLADIVVLTTSDTLEMRRREFPKTRVEPIAFASSELTVADWRFLMGASANDALYLRLVDEVIRSARANLTLDAVEAGVQAAPMSDGQRQLALTRLSFARRFIDDSRSLRPILTPGRLVIVDLRDEFVEREQALGLFVTLLNVFSGAGLDGPEPFNKLIVFDEAHKYMGGTLIGSVVDVIRQMRHKGVSVVVASQDPVNVPPAVIELSSVVALHRFNSPNWLKHIQKALASLADLTPQMLASLMPGEAFVWANRATDPVFTRRAIKARIRPRASHHGGSTKTAVE